MKREEFDLLICGGRIIDPASGLDRTGDVYVKGKRIVKIETKKKSNPAKCGTDEKVIDARDKIVCPGLVDMHTHLREPGREDEETIYTASEAAVAGGFTSICCMPNTEPPIDNQESVNFIYEKAKLAKCKIYPIACITKEQKGEELTEMADLKNAGAVAVSDDGKPVSNSRMMRYALEYSKMIDLPLVSHCEDLDLSSEGAMQEGFVSTVLGIKGIPSSAEEIMVARDIRLSEFTGGSLHIAHVSTSGALDFIKEAKKQGVKLTCEVTPHHFTLTDESIKTFDTNCKVNPPLRTKKDVEMIKKGLKNGIINAIATDHAPHSIEEKDVEFDAAPFGMIGLETCLGLVISELIEKKILTWKEAIAKLSYNPARILHLNAGELKAGGPADITIIDPACEWTVDPNKFHSKSKNSPFGGWKLKGKAWMTIVDGKIVFKLEG
jgi:dihydroorotase